MAVDCKMSVQRVHNTIRDLRCSPGTVHTTDNRCRPRCSSRDWRTRNSDTTKLCLRTRTLYRYIVIIVLFITNFITVIIIITFV